MKKSKLLPFVVIIALSWTAPSSAQSRREALINEARNQFSDSVAMGLYLSAMDPALGGPDSLWAVAGFDLADRLVLLERQTLSSTWLRWLARHGAQWPIDRGWYLPSLVEEYDLALEELRRTADSGPASTTWRWPRQFDAGAAGSVQATISGRTTPVTVAVEGQEGAPAAETLSLPTGTYTLVVSAEGYEPAHFVREILPGVTTVLHVDLVPLLPAQVRDSVAENLVRIIYTLDGREVCRNGFFTGRDGLVLTTMSALQGGTSIRVAAFNDQERFTNVPVVASNMEKDLAVLQINTDRQASLPWSSTVVEGQHAWSVHFAGCAGLTSARTQLTGWPSSPSSPGQVGIPLPVGSVGAPLVDRSGSLLGLVSGPTTVVPFALAEDVLDQARQDRSERARQDLAAQIAPPKRFPWKWVGAGVGAAGLAFALTQGSSGSKPPPTTGGIILTFPSGG